MSNGGDGVKTASQPDREVVQRHGRTAQGLDLCRISGEQRQRYVWVGLKQQPPGQVDRDVREVVAGAHHEKIGGSLGISASTAVHADPARAEVVEMPELDGTDGPADESERRADGDLDRCADSTEVAIEVRGARGAPFTPVRSYPASRRSAIDLSARNATLPRT